MKTREVRTARRRGTSVVTTVHISGCDPRSIEVRGKVVGEMPGYDRRRVFEVAPAVPLPADAPNRIVASAWNIFPG